MLEDELKWVRVKVRTKGVYNVWRSLQRKRRGRTAGPPIAVAGTGTGTGTGGSSSGNSRNGGDGDEHDFDGDGDDDDSIECAHMIFVRYR